MAYLNNLPDIVYNEFDDYAADWLENLIRAGAIAPGVVDRRSITEVASDDYRNFRQVHLFAGIGVWSYALRRAGWSDDRPVWTGSCPCPPFSAAGKKKACPGCGGTNPVPHVGRTGFFVCCLCGHEWFADSRHLWPEFWRLLRDNRPDDVLGEQVAGADGLIWLDTVSASMEMLDYAVGSVDSCAAGFGAPQIRQRIYWSGAQPLGDANHTRLEGWRQSRRERARERATWASRVASRVAFAHDPLWRPDVPAGHEFYREDARWTQDSGYVGVGSGSGIVAGRTDQHGRPGPVNGFWRSADWLFGRDAGWRPVEPCTFPLATRSAGRVGRLRAYGNALNGENAIAFVIAYARARALENFGRL